MSAESENGKSAQLEIIDKEIKKDDGIDGDKKNAATKPEKVEDTKLKSDEAKEDSENEDKKENNKENATADKDGKEEVDKKEVKDDKKEKSKQRSDEDGSEKEDNADEEDEDDDQEDGDDDDDETDGKKGKKTSPKKKGSLRSKDKKNDDEEDEEDGEDETGLELGEIPRIDASISRFKNDDLKMLHKLLFKSPIKTPLLKKNIRKFSGFDFKKSSDEYQKKLTSMSSFEVKQLRVICEMLDLEKKGNRDELSERILDFLLEPKDAGKPAGGGRPRRSAAVKANNRGYSDEEYSSDETSPRAKRNAGKRSNLKDETSTEESDEDFKPSDESEEEKPRAKRGRAGRRKKDDSEEEEESEDSEESDYSDEPRSKQRKVANNKGKGRGGGATRGRRGRPAATPAKRKAPAKRGRKKQETSEEEEESEAHDASSSEDEPLAKKSAKNPPTDDEIKTYVKEILDGANLEEITMKTVCKQVYAHYPDFDLTHKKDYIKSTVKSLIST